MKVDSGVTGTDTFQTLSIRINVNYCPPTREGKSSVAHFLNRPVNRELLLARMCNKMEQLLSLDIKQIHFEYEKYRFAKSYEADVFETNQILPGLNGKWKNELGSVVEFEASENGELKGSFQSQVGHAAGTKHNIVGSWSVVNEGALISFVVNWNNLLPGAKRSTTAWSGRLYLNPLQIVTTWILTTDLPKNQDWKSVSTNKDIFTKIHSSPA